MLLFLDADDWLYPAAIEKMLNVWNIEHRIVYTDYVGRTPISDVTELAEDLQKHIYQYDGTTAIIGYRAAEFDCGTYFCTRFQLVSSMHTIPLLSVSVS